MSSLFDEKPKTPTRATSKSRVVKPLQSVSTNSTNLIPALFPTSSKEAMVAAATAGLARGLSASRLKLPTKQETQQTTSAPHTAPPTPSAPAVVETPLKLQTISEDVTESRQSLHMSSSAIEPPKQLVDELEVTTPRALTLAVEAPVSVTVVAPLTTSTEIPQELTPLIEAAIQAKVGSQIIALKQEIVELKATLHAVVENSAKERLGFVLLRGLFPFLTSDKTQSLISWLNRYKPWSTEALFARFWSVALLGDVAAIFVQHKWPQVIQYLETFVGLAKLPPEWRTRLALLRFFMEISLVIQAFVELHDVVVNFDWSRAKSFVQGLGRSIWDWRQSFITTSLAVGASMLVLCAFRARIGTLVPSIVK